jgi:PAS domain-containing protein
MSSSDHLEVTPSSAEAVDVIDAYEAIFRYSPLIIWIWDVETGYFLAANEAAVDL